MLFKYLSFGVKNGVFHGHWQFTGQQGKEGDDLLFHSTTSTCSQTFRHLFATLYLRWLSHILNSNACIYQTATRWDLPLYRIAIWMINDVMLIFFCLLVDLILGFVTAIWLFDMRNRWTRTLVDYHPCITSEPTNQVC